MHTVLAARDAMNTRFEVLLQGAEPLRLRAAAEEALDEVERLDHQLSRFQPTSEIAQINTRAAQEPVPVEPRVLRLLAAAKRISEETLGAFDPTLAPLLDAWGFPRGSDQIPSTARLTELGEAVGVSHLLLNESAGTVRFARTGLRLDLGAIGKGYAVECAACLLRELGVESGLIHAGTSTVFAWGTPPGTDGWRVGIARPDVDPSEQPALGARRSELGGAVTRVSPWPSETSAGEEPPASDSLACVVLRDEALSVSASQGRTRRVEGRTVGHVLDPRTGHPISGASLAAVVTPSAADADALSTALLVLGRTGLDRIASLRPSLYALLATRAEPGGAWRVERRGSW